mgnify:CR=1 FL=1
MNAEQILHGLIIHFVILVIVKKKKRTRKRNIGQGLYAFITMREYRKVISNIQ